MNRHKMSAQETVVGSRDIEEAMHKIYVTIFCLLLSGCVSQSATLATGVDKGERICVVRNMAVSTDFRVAYMETLENVGLQPIAVDTPEGCSLSTRYVAHFGFHWGLYLARAKLEVFREDKLIAEATYKAPRMDPSKHGRVKGKVQKLVDQMFAKPG